MKKLMLKREFWELSFLFALVGCSLIALSAASKIPPSYFDQLGSSFFPTLIAWLIIGLSCPLILKNIKELYIAYSNVPLPLDIEDRTRLIQVILISILSIAYIVGFSLKTIPYSLLTGLFVSLAVFCLKENRKQHMYWIILAAFIGGGFLEYLFTQVFVMDLPRFYF